jgi:integrase
MQTFIVDSFESLTEHEKNMLVDSAFGLDRIMLLLLFDSGLKVEDLIETKTSDVDLVEGTVMIRSSREMKKISPKVLAELKNYLETRPSQVYLFEGRCGKPITAKWKKCVLEELIRKVVRKKRRELKSV